MLFQAAGCGAAVLNEFRPKLAEAFDVGKEVLAFHDFDQLLDQATQLLNEPGLTAQPVTPPLSAPIANTLTITV